MPYSVKMLEFAHIKCSDSVLFDGGDKDKTTVIGCFAYLLQKDGENILVDAGIEDIDVVNSTRTSSKDNWERDDSEADLLGNLKKLGVSADSISKVLLTHSHYDHISGISHLKNAKIYMTKAEYDFLMSEDNNLKNVLADAKDFVKNAMSTDMLVLVDDEFCVNNEIRVFKVGGHTAGSMMVEAKTQNGKALFTGDSVFLLSAVENGLSIGLTTSRQDSDNAVKICKEFDGAILTGHDVKCRRLV